MKYINNSDITKELQEDLNESKHAILPEGTFIIKDTIYLGDGMSLEGLSEKTIIKLDDAVNKNMFTNKDYKSGNSNIKIRNIKFDGNWKKQFKPNDEKRVSFCNIFYLANTRDIYFQNIYAIDAYQTVLHFNKCSSVVIKGLDARCLGWSGISTSGTNNLNAQDIYIYDSGKDHRHSAIHLDGGIGAYIEADIDKCVGNGVMLDATFSEFKHAVVKANCRNCMRGVSLIGSPGKVPMYISIEGGVMSNNQIGVMVSNASYAFISNVFFDRNSETALLFQGRVGGSNSVASKCIFSNNNENIREIHNSENNFFFNLYYEENQ